MKPLYRSKRLFSLYNFISLFSLFHALPSSTTKDTQQLLSFKAALPNPSLLKNWLPNQNPCYFTGVLCKSARVTSLDLSYTALNTELRFVSSFLLTLDHLESLTLKSTNLTGSVSTFSSSKYCTASLLDIDLSNNTLTGSLTDLSSFIPLCSSLKSLNLSSNSLEVSPDSGAGFQLSTVESLDLSYNRIIGANVVGYIISSGCDELKHLSLKNNKVSGNIPLSKCKSLEYLDLSSNNFSIVVPSFGGCMSLFHLDLSSNKFRGHVAASLAYCHQLSYLNLSSNQFSPSMLRLPINFVATYPSHHPCSVF